MLVGMDDITHRLFMSEKEKVNAGTKIQVLYETTKQDERKLEASRLELGSYLLYVKSIGMPHSEICEIMGISLQRLYQILLKAEKRALATIPTNMNLTPKPDSAELSALLREHSQKIQDASS